MLMKVNNNTINDPDNPEWTADDFARAKPAKEIAPEFVAQFTKAQKEGTLEIVPTRGKQKAPLKKPTTIRLSADVMDFFKAQGKGWQTRIDNVLKEYVAKHS